MKPKNSDIRGYTEAREAEPLIVRRGPLEGEIWLRGYADGYHGRAAIVQRTKKARRAYAKGFEAGTQARRNLTPTN